MNFTAKSVSGDGTLTVLVDETSYVVGTEHPSYLSLVKAFKDNDADEFVRCLNVQEAFKSYVNSANSSKVELVGDVVHYNGKPVHTSLGKRISELMRDGFDFQPMLNFLDNLMQNPSKNSVDQLYDFLDHMHLPITEDGHFIAYKSVKEDFWSKAGGDLTLTKGKTNSSGQIFNGVGEVITCNRNEVDDNPNNHCSKGLHVGALEYAGPDGWYHNSADQVVLVKVNPKDAVSVPTDHNFQKLRTCGYEVVGVFKEALKNAAYKAECGKVEVCNVVEDTLDDVWDEVCPEDLLYGDAVKFWYVNSRGEKNMRYARVESTEDGYVTCALLTSDPNFYKHDYASFKMDNMSEVKFLE